MTFETNLWVGGLVAAGFDASGDYLLAISHAGRGVFCTKTWKRIARSYELAYPKDGIALGIGPIEGQRIPLTELDFATGRLELASPDGRTELAYGEGTLAVSRAIPPA